MKPITNILLLLALVSYIFLPLFEISLVGNLTGLQFTASMISANLSVVYTLYSLLPFLLLFAAIAFNCLKNRYWGVLVALLIFGVIYFFATLTRMFQGFSLVHDPSVVADTQMGEGMPIVGVGLGFYCSFVLTVLAFVSALVSLMPFKFNKKLEESIDGRIGKGLKSGRRQISKVGHGIHDEFHRIGKHNRGAIDSQNSADSADSTDSTDSADSSDSSDSTDSGDSSDSSDSTDSGDSSDH